MENIVFLAIGFTLGFGVLNIKNAYLNYKKSRDILKYSKSIKESINNLRFRTTNDLLDSEVHTLKFNSDNKYEEAQELNEKHFYSSYFGRFERREHPTLSAISNIKLQLKEALDNEDYILAANLRDKINLLNNEI